MRPLFAIALSLGLLFTGLNAEGRVWTSKTGHYKVEAEVIAFNDHLVVLKKESGELIAVELNQLSEADQKFVASQETKDAAKKHLDAMQTWTGKDGLKMNGRVVAFGKRDLKVQRKLGTVHINDRKFSAIDPLHQKLVLKIISHLEKTKLEDEKQLESWAKSIGGEPKVYPLEGVLMQLESGDEIGSHSLCSPARIWKSFSLGGNSGKNATQVRKPASRRVF